MEAVLRAPRFASMQRVQSDCTDGRKPKIKLLRRAGTRFRTQSPQIAPKTPMGAGSPFDPRPACQKTSNEPI
eukprot:scaffold241120_cov33-Tisochrysis_lutea.AAC.2